MAHLWDPSAQKAETGGLLWASWATKWVGSNSGLWSENLCRKGKKKNSKKKGFKNVIFHFHVWWIVYRASYVTVSTLCINTFYALSARGNLKKVFSKREGANLLCLWPWILPVSYLQGLRRALWERTDGFQERGLPTSPREAGGSLPSSSEVLLMHQATVLALTPRVGWRWTSALDNPCLGRAAMQMAWIIKICSCLSHTASRRKPLFCDFFLRNGWDEEEQTRDTSS